MVVYIRQSKLPSEVSINKYNAQVGAYLQGEEVILYQSFSEIKQLTSDDTVVDYITETRALHKMMGLKRSGFMTILLSLKSFMVERFMLVF